MKESEKWVETVTSRQLGVGNGLHLDRIQIDRIGDPNPLIIGFGLGPFKKHTYITDSFMIIFI